MGVRTDCRHYSSRSTAGGDALQRCRVNANETMPFACPESCVFFEASPISSVGWERVEPSEGRAPRDDEPPG